MSFEPKLDWKYDDDVTEQHFNRWEKGIKEAHDNIAFRQIENVGYGVHAGLEVSSSVTPDMNVHVQSGVVYVPNGERYEFSTVKTIAVNAADATNPRKDIIYVSASGLIEYVAGVPAATPTEPVLPSGTIHITAIDVPAATSAIEQAQLIDTRIMKGNLQSLEQEVDEHQKNHLRIELSMAAPTNPGTNTWWYEDLGESIEFGGGGGLVMGNASTSEGSDIWFDENA